MSIKNPILSSAENYTQPVVRKAAPPGNKKMPYSFLQAKNRLYRKLTTAIDMANLLPEGSTPDNKIVTALTLHPSFLAKSFYPKDIFEKYSLTNLGSKEIFISPEVSVTDEQRLGNISTSLYFISGKKQSFAKLARDLNESAMDEASQNDLIKIEDFSLFQGQEKLIGNSKKGDELACYEVVLHAASNDNIIIDGFFNYISSLPGECYKEKTRSLNGLTFCFVKIKPSKIEQLANFSFVRVVRPMPEIKLSDRLQNLDFHAEHSITSHPGINSRINSASIAIFDGGLTYEATESAHIRYFDLTNSKSDSAVCYAHGARVTSAIVYGDVENYKVENNPALDVDHYKVYSQADEIDIGLVDVLDRIRSVLVKNRYKFVNISLGPEYPCSDFEPSLWTSTLDQLAENGDVLIAVAVGNAGMLDNEFSRIQPPSDMINGISIGAANSKDENWEKSSYSSIGPGRRPGFVKPDALYFGGESGEASPKVHLIKLDSFELEYVWGTSYATPLVVRQAALIDHYTNGKLNVATIRALLIHSTKKSNQDRKHCGWGLIDSDIANIVFCSDKRVTLIYQGKLKTANGVRAAVPFPEALSGVSGKVNIEATICFYTEVDPQHTVSYTKAGIEVTFRPNADSFKFDKKTNAYAKEANTRSLFNKESIFGDEQKLRRDSHKWETCYKVYDRLMISTLKEPIFDLKYMTREEGHPLSPKDMKNLKPLDYSLIVSIEVEKDFDLYDSILNQYSLLTPVDISMDVDVTL